MIIPEIGREDLEIGTQIYNRADEYEGGATVSLNHTELLRIIEEEIGDDKGRINKIHTLVRNSIELRDLLKPNTDTWGDLWHAMKNSDDPEIIGQAVLLRRLLIEEPKQSIKRDSEPVPESLSDTNVFDSKISEISDIPPQSIGRFKNEGIETIGHFLIHQTLFHSRSRECSIPFIGEETMKPINSMLASKNIQLPLTSSQLFTLVSAMDERSVDLIGGYYLDRYKKDQHPTFERRIDIGLYIRARTFADILGRDMDDYLDDQDLIPHYIRIGDEARKQGERRGNINYSPRANIDLIKRSFDFYPEMMQPLRDIIEALHPVDPRNPNLGQIRPVKTRPSQPSDF